MFAIGRRRADNFTGVLAHSHVCSDHTGNLFVEPDRRKCFGNLYPQSVKWIRRTKHVVEIFIKTDYRLQRTGEEDFSSRGLVMRSKRLIQC